MALGCASVAFIGFAPTYWLPVASQKLKVNPVLHVHGAVFFAWSLYFVFQTWLASSGRIARHRSVGLIGVSLATAMTIFGTLASINAMKEAAAIGMRGEGIAFAIVPLSGTAFFAGSRRNPLIQNKLLEDFATAKRELDCRVVAGPDCSLQQLFNHCHL
jgi:hypothetical protein